MYKPTKKPPQTHPKSSPQALKSSFPLCPPTLASRAGLCQGRIWGPRAAAAHPLTPGTFPSQHAASPPQGAVPGHPSRVLMWVTRSGDASAGGCRGVAGHHRLGTAARGPAGDPRPRSNPPEEAKLGGCHPLWRGG